MFCIFSFSLQKYLEDEGGIIIFTSRGEAQRYLLHQTKFSGPYTIIRIGESI